MSLGLAWVVTGLYASLDYKMRLCLNNPSEAPQILSFAVYIPTCSTMLLIFPEGIPIVSKINLKAKRILKILY